MRTQMASARSKIQEQIAAANKQAESPSKTWKPVSPHPSIIPRGAAAHTQTGAFLARPHVDRSCHGPCQTQRLST